MTYCLWTGQTISDLIAKFRPTQDLCNGPNVIVTALTTASSPPKTTAPSKPLLSPCPCAWSSPQTGRTGYRRGGRWPEGDVEIQPKFEVKGGSIGKVKKASTRNVTKAKCGINHI
ncbi:hypothetical protein UPYG_G00136740 [Umbra pygmaea]|uniref:Uncharacterized protein n=1 Tax=Umbra pygmaea TaxID=75934 RepID=A0ABD0WUC5_UMBPY